MPLMFGVKFEVVKSSALTIIPRIEINAKKSKAKYIKNTQIEERIFIILTRLPASVFLLQPVPPLPIGQPPRLPPLREHQPVSLCLRVIVLGQLTKPFLPQCQSFLEMGMASLRPSLRQKPEHPGKAKKLRRL